MKYYREMTDAELTKRMSELSNILNGGLSAEWDEAYDEYFDLSAEQDRRYRLKYREPFEAFYEEHIKGKSWEEIDPDDWQTYSDWHKDMYGYRPRTI